MMFIRRVLPGGLLLAAAISMGQASPRLPYAEATAVAIAEPVPGRDDSQGGAPGQGRQGLPHPVRQAPGPVAHSPDPGHRRPQGHLGGRPDVPAGERLPPQGERPAARGLRRHVPDRGPARGRQGSPSRRRHDSRAPALPGLRRHDVLPPDDDSGDLDVHGHGGRKGSCASCRRPPRSGRPGADCVSHSGTGRGPSLGRPQSRRGASDRRPRTCSRSSTSSRSSGPRAAT